MKRGEMLQMTGLAGGGLLALGKAAQAATKRAPIPPFARPVTTIVIGAGNRGHDHYAG